MRISDWSSDVCSSDLSPDNLLFATISRGFRSGAFNGTDYVTRLYDAETLWNYEVGGKFTALDRRLRLNPGVFYMDRSEEHTSELQSLMRISYAVFCLKKKITKTIEYIVTLPQPTLTTYQFNND